MLSLEITKDIINHVIDDIRNIGFAVIKNVLDQNFLELTIHNLYDVQQKIIKDVGKHRLERASEIGVLRLMMKYNPFFLSFLNLSIVHEIVNLTVSETAILHLQNGFINPPISGNVDNIPQYQFHRDFPRIMNGYLASINIMFAISEFSEKNGATLVVSGTHQKEIIPTDKYFHNRFLSIECPPGSMIIFDSTLFHAAGKNISSGDRLGINHQFTRSFFKQQIDYVRALDLDLITAQPPRVQQLLGYNTRVVTNLDEYYRPENERLYKKGQG